MNIPSKSALQESWNEVEDLQCQCAENVNLESRLTADLTKSRTDEENWRIRCLAAEKTMSLEDEIAHKDAFIRRQSIGSIEGINETSACTVHSVHSDMQLQQSVDKNPLLTFRDKIRSWSSGNLRGMDEMTKTPLSNFNSNAPPCESKHSLDQDEAYYRGAEAKMQQILDSRSMSSSPIGSVHDPYDTNIPEEEFFIEAEVQTAGEISIPNQFYLHGNAKSQEDLSLIISSRDEVIDNLERTLNQQLNNMQNMQSEMKCLMETQRIKEKRVSDKHKLKEQRLDKLVVSMREKLKSNEMSSKKQDEQLTALKSYIQELADELENVLKIVKKAEDEGFLFDSNPQKNQ